MQRNDSRPIPIFASPLKIAVVFSVAWGVYAAFAAVTYLGHIQSLSEPDPGRRAELALTEFLGKTKPVFSAEFREAAGDAQTWVADRELLDPLTALPQAYRFPREALAKLRETELACLKMGESSRVPQANKSALPELEKYAVWNRFVCGQAKLPENFFREPPFSFPLGGSWTMHARNSPRSPWPPASSQWIDLAKFFHFLELKHLYKPAETPPLLDIRPGELAALLAGAPVVIGAEYLLLRHNGPNFANAGNTLSVFSRSEAQNFFRNQTFAFVPAEAGNCPAKIGELCVANDPAAAAKRQNFYFAVFAASVALLLAWIAYLVWKKVSGDRKSQRERDLMIQTLAHELRHPAASLQLSLETFRREFDALPEGAQDEFLRMADQVQRLSRVIHASRQYLQSNAEGTQSFQFQLAKVDSYEDFVRETAEPYAKKIAISFGGPDGAVKIDPYWTALCVTNLIKNALIHGKAPIRLRASLERSELVIEVDDDGRAALSFEEMIMAFRKRPESPGMGLGLSLVHRLTELMGGKLEFSGPPTLFRIRLPKEGR